MVLPLRALTAEDHAKIERLTRAQSAPVRLVRRARMIQLAAQGLTAPAIAQQLGVSEKAVRQRLERFTVEGMAGLDDAPRSGRPRTYTEDAYSRVIAKARELPPKPADSDGGGERAVPPTCHWTLDRLQAELAKEGLPIKRSQIRRLLKAEHITWQKSRTWLESTDPDFAEKRGPSSASTPSRLPAAR
ncbi:MAG TPA: helix-turn-helix domain-containing protein [Ktedonobacterales bacterium]|nr:helix-turn-helix domain-containing protein [Ktedonobacterales bacterium]